MVKSDWIGWIATAVFASSYFYRDARSVSRLQALGALIWIGYGLLIAAPPVVGANLIVAAAAAYSGWRKPPQ